MTILNYDTLKAQALSFLEHVSHHLTQANIVLESHWDVDHLCYRTSTNNMYEEVKKQFLMFAKLLIESEVNGRLISTFKLSQPISFAHWIIDVIEVPAPKVGRPAQVGFEHLEVVCDIPFEQVKQKYPNCLFDESGLKKDFNQELEISLNDFAIKFHHISLESVTRLESNHQIINAIKQLNPLKLLKPYGPLIAGTFPLDLNVNGSDVDILVSSNDLKQVKHDISNYFGTCVGFKMTENKINGIDSIIAQFEFQNIGFEIFGQNIPAVQQDGYKHFLIEERLLKLGGDSLRSKIMKLRQAGMKTEPAFAQHLDLTGDPFEALLKLQKWNFEQLKSALKMQAGSN